MSSASEKTVEIKIDHRPCINHPDDIIDCIEPPIYECKSGKLGKSFLFFEHHKTGLPYTSLTAHNEKIERMVMDNFFDVQPDNVVFDIGAQYGIYTFRALLMGARHVYVFEPIQDFLFSLYSSVKLNKWQQRVTLFGSVLWDSKTMIEFDNLFHMTGCHTKPTFNNTSIQTNTLDNMFETNPIDRLDVLKIDVEGAELRVLRGALNTIRRYRPKMIIELHGDSEKTIKSLIEVLNEILMGDKIGIYFLYVDRLYCITRFMD